MFALTFNEERASRCLLGLDGASRVISLLRQHSDSLAHQGTRPSRHIAHATPHTRAHIPCGTESAGYLSELCWTLANAFHCARRDGQQPTLAEDDISLFAQLLQSDNVKVLFVFSRFYAPDDAHQRHYDHTTVGHPIRGRGDSRQRFAGCGDSGRRAAGLPPSRASRAIARRLARGGAVLRGLGAGHRRPGASRVAYTRKAPGSRGRGAGQRLATNDVGRRGVGT